jgi:hypothetical protein
MRQTPDGYLWLGKLLGGLAYDRGNKFDFKVCDCDDTPSRLPAGTGFGRMKLGQTAEAINKVYCVNATIESWHEHMTLDLSW